MIQAAEGAVEPRTRAPDPFLPCIPVGPRLALPEPMKILDGFAATLAPYDLEELVRSANTIFAIDANGRIAFVNDAWLDFSRANGGGDMDAWFGRVWRKCIPEALVDFYADGLDAARSMDEPWDHEYECSSPDVRRLLRATVSPLEGGGFLFVHAIVLETPHGTVSSGELGPGLRDASGMIVQCCHCRCVRVPTTRQWLFVRSVVASPPPFVSHGLCEPCLAWHYPDSALAPRATG